MAKLAQNKCGPGQPPGPHCSWMPRLHLHRARRLKCTLTRPHSDRNTRLLTYPRFTSESRRSRKTSSLVLPCEQGPSEEAATPGYPEARRSTPWETSSSSPSRTAEAASSAAIFSRRLKHLTHALPALCLNLQTPATKNEATVVQKLWRTKIPCGKRWKKTGKFPSYGLRDEHETKMLNQPECLGSYRASAPAC